MIKYGNKTRKRKDQFSVRIQLSEGFLLKYANAVERKVTGRHLPDKTAPSKSKKFYKIPPTAKKARPQKQRVVC
jgi:hypothetical protein